MKKIISFLLVFLMAVNLIACSNSPSSSASENNNQSDSSNEKIEVEKEVFDVTITLPASLVGEVTQEELDADMAEGKVYSAVVNEDGSVTYTMSKSQHKILMSEMAEEIESSLSEMVASEEFPNFTKIDVNDDYTHFTVTTKSEKLDFAESFSVLGFYMLGGIYSAFNGDTDTVITVDFVNADSGEIISSASSDEMSKE